MININQSCILVMQINGSQYHIKKATTDLVTFPIIVIATAALFTTLISGIALFRLQFYKNPLLLLYGNLNFIDIMISVAEIATFIVYKRAERINEPPIFAIHNILIFIHLPRKTWPFTVTLLMVMRIRILLACRPLTLNQVRFFIAITWIFNILRVGLESDVKLGFLNLPHSNWYNALIIGVSSRGVDVVIHMTNVILLTILGCKKSGIIRTINDKASNRGNEEEMLRQVRRNFNTLFGFLVVYVITYLPDTVYNVAFLVAMIYDGKSAVLSAISTARFCVIFYMYAATVTGIMTLTNSLILLRTSAIWCDVKKMFRKIAVSVERKIQYTPTHETYYGSTNDICYSEQSRQVNANYYSE